MPALLTHEFVPLVLLIFYATMRILIMKDLVRVNESREEGTRLLNCLKIRKEKRDRHLAYYKYILMSAK